MKRCFALLIALSCGLALIGCQGAISNSDVYSFPEPMTQISGTVFSSGGEAPFEVGAESAKEWFYGLKLTVCDKPEDVEGAKSYCFFMNEEEVFCYEDRGGSTAYIIVGGNYYDVSNPSVPPISYYD